MSSQLVRNSTPLRATTTSNMLAANRLKKNQETPRFFRPASSHLPAPSGRRAGGEGRHAFADTRSHRRPPTSSPPQSPPRRPPKARRFPCWPKQTASATPAAAIATGRKRARPATGARPLRRPTRRRPRRSGTRLSDFCRRPTRAGPRPSKSPIAIKNQTMTEKTFKAVDAGGGML